MIKLKYNDEYILVSEYHDAKKLIMQLSDKYAGDVTAVSRGGNGRNKTEYYNYPCSFDIETTTIRPGELDYAGTDADPPLAFPYLFQFNIYGSVIFCRKYSECMDVFSWISQYFRLGGNRKMVIFDHNLSYEYGFFRDLWKIIPEKSFALDEHHPVTIYTEDGFMFRDSYKMTNMSLETLTKDWSRKYIKDKELIDYSVLRTPYSKLDHDTMLYSALDVLSLSDAIEAFLDARGERIWTRCPTSTSFIRQELKKRIGVGARKRTPEQHAYQRYLKDQKITLEQYKLLKRIARGGNTHANRAITGKLMYELAHFDITSSYPAQMVCYPEYPIGVWYDFHPGTSIEDMELFEERGYCCMMDIALFNPRLKEGVTVPYISASKMTIIEGSGMKYTDNGRYVSGIKTLGISIFGIEWPIIKQQYDFDGACVLRGWFSKKGYLPDIVRDYVLELYAAKTELKGIPEKAVEYAVSKGAVNGIFGMAFTDNISRQRYEFEDNDIVEAAPRDPAEALEKYQKSISYFSPYVVGCMVAALGRVYLQKMIDAAGPDFCYCDTDSTFAKKSNDLIRKMQELETDLTAYQRQCGKQLIYNDIKGRPHELGGIDMEPDCQYFLTYGAKKYITVENGKLTLTVAGVPKKTGAHLLSRHVYKKRPIINFFDKDHGARRTRRRLLSIGYQRFKLGFNFRGDLTGKNCLWYNPDPGFTLHDEQGREIEIHSNVAMLPCDYLLSMSKDYLECLSIEGNFHWNFKELYKGGVINEEDYI